METIYELPVKYYAFLYEDYPDYKDLQDSMKMCGDMSVDERIVLYMQHATAAVFIGDLTDNQVTVFKANAIKQYRHRARWNKVKGEWSRDDTITAKIELVPKLLIPKNATLLLRQLRDSAGFVDEWDIITRIAERVRKLDNSNLTWENADDSTVATLKQKFEEQHKQTTPLIEAPVEEKIEGVVDISLLLITHEKIAEWNTTSLTKYKGKGYAKLARDRLDSLGQPYTQDDVNRGAKNMENWIKGYRKEQQKTS